MTLLNRVCDRLLSESVGFCVIGAAAMAVHGVVRATADLDLFTLDSRTLTEEFWAVSLGDSPVDVRRGDADDPLRGVVRVGSSTRECVDIVVGHGGWQDDVLANAQRTTVLGVHVPVATARDLVALKLYAGGPQDAWDVHQLLDLEPALAEAVDEFVARLPTDARRLWEKLRAERS